MKRPLQSAVSPAGGYRLRFPDGHEVADYSDRGFMARVYNHLAANDYQDLPWNTSGGWVERMWHETILQHPNIPHVDDDAPRERVFDGDDFKRWLRTMWETWKSGEKAVDEETQNARVDVCLRCPRLGFIQCGGGCGSISETLSEFLMGRKIPKLPEIHKQSCLACGCPAEIKTLWPISVLRTVDEKLGMKPEYHPSCWILAEEKNLTGEGTMEQSPSTN